MVINDVSDEGPTSTAPSVRDHNLPRAFNLSDLRERARLFREVAGYLRTCRTTRCGGDFEGRAFALEAMETLAKEAKERDELNMRLRGAGL